MAKLSYVVNNVVYRKKHDIWGCLLCKNIKNSCEILLLMSCKMSLNCTEMAYINNIIYDINHEISLQEQVC